jgi:ELWxxDGT repeat protein
VLVKDIFPGRLNSLPQSLTAVGNTLFFNASVGTDGFELWKSDGTAEGTVLARDINPGPGSSDPQLMAGVGGACSSPPPTAPTAWSCGRPDARELGVLQLAEGRLSFTLKDGTVPFDAPLGELEVLGWPSYGIAPNSQVKLRIEGKKHRVSFVAPVNSREVQDPMDVSATQLPQQAARALRTYPPGMETGEAWRAVLPSGT